MEPDRQMEIQLGHMCNNRCVFCVSGQRTAMREAFPLESAPVMEKIREGYAQGIRKLTLLGGEPTIQPEFMNIVRFAVGLGFEEIVIFTNGVKTAREAFVDEVLATGGNFTWRLSLQGATGAAHDRTTRKLGSFQRLRETMAILHRKGQRITVNMCVVRTNYESIGAFPALLRPIGVRQLHLDMMRPLDAGIRTEDEMRAMIPRYTDLVPHLERMIAGFPEDFDVNVGNLPYCVAPHLARWIHHDGERTFTVAIDGDDALSEPWDKYEVKKRDKVKRDACAECVFDAQCSGVYDTYRRFYGMDEFAPVTRERLVQLDPALKLFTLHVKPFLAQLEGWTPPAPFGPPAVRVDSRQGEVGLRFEGEDGAFADVVLRRPGRGVASTDRFSLHLLDAHEAGPVTVALLRALLARLCEGGGARVIHPVAADAGHQSARPRELGAGLDLRLAACLGRLRARAPFGALSWQEVQVAADGREATVSLAEASGTTVEITLAVRGSTVAGGYRFGGRADAHAPGLAQAVRAAMDALRAPA
jgi:MoaA/NifB/PqqE/SkfB family radical SAM enzyme